jgi:hypothetical protein
MASNKHYPNKYACHVANVRYRDWNELGFDFPCPIHFTEDELRSHVKDAEGWNDVQNFWNSVEGVVTRDGWTPNGLYDAAVALFSELREVGLKTMVGKDREDFKAQTQWVEEPSSSGDSGKLVV